MIDGIDENEKCICWFLVVTYRIVSPLCGQGIAMHLLYIPVGVYFWAVSRMRRSMLWLCSCCVDSKYLSFINASQDNSSSSSI